MPSWAAAKSIRLAEHARAAVAPRPLAATAAAILGQRRDGVALLAHAHLGPAAGKRRVVEVPIEAVQPGDLVEVRGGESIPADGSVLEGESSVNRALLTGESQPTAVGPGNAVNAGTVNLSSRLVVRVEAVGEATRVGRLMQMVEQHSRNRPPIVQFADRIAGSFVRIVLAVAAMTFFYLDLDQSRQGDR